MSKKKKLLFLIITGVLLSGVSAFASYLINSSEVEYDPETSGLSSTNVQGAIDELYSRTTTLQSEKEALQQQLENAVSQEDLEAAQAACPSGMNCLTDEELQAANAPSLSSTFGIRYAFGTPTNSSTTDYTTLGKNVFIGKSGDQLAVCIIYNNKLECFKNNNYENELEHGKQVFGESNCSSSSCNAGDFGCHFNSDGFVDCVVSGSYCYVSSDVIVSCGG